MTSRANRASLVFLFDLAAVAMSWLTAFWIRFNLQLSPEDLHIALRSLTWVVPIYGASFFFHGLYRGLWLFASIPDLFRLARGVIVGTVIVLAFAFMFGDGGVVPRSAFVLTPSLLLLAMSTPRIAYRAWKERGLIGNYGGSRKPVLLLGAGRAGAMLARELARSPEWRVVGFLDDDRAKIGREIHGHEVLGPLTEVEWRGRERGVSTVILTLPSAPKAVQSRVAHLAIRAGLEVLRAPRIDELKDGKTSISNVRRISVDDLLGRESVVIDDANVEGLVRGQVVLVTGAGGSIGSEICRQLARFSPRQLILFENSEFALYRIEEEFRSRFPEREILALAGDVRDRERVQQVFAQYKPRVVFHAAAYKHVPLMECHNAWQAVRTNVVGTHVVAQAAHDHGTEDFILISTDKAVNPANVMGATKRLAEMTCQALHQATDGRTQFKIVRFGNVVGSAGSVIPKFQTQIEHGGPVTVTHPEVTRYFMSIPEAAQLVLQAGTMGNGGEIFVMEMGKPLKIADLARDMIRLAGHSEEEIPIAFTGLRPGEKLFEEVLALSEETLPTPHPKLRIARARQVEPDGLLRAVGELASRSDPGDDATRRLLRQLIPEYKYPLLVEIKSAMSEAQSAVPVGVATDGTASAPLYAARGTADA